MCDTTLLLACPALTHASVCVRILRQMADVSKALMCLLRTGDINGSCPWRHAFARRRKPDAPSQVGADDATAFVRRRPTGNATWVPAPPGTSQHQRWNGGSLVHFRSRHRVTEQASGDGLPLIKRTLDGCDAAQCVQQDIRQSQGQQARSYEGRNPAGFSRGTEELLKKLHLSSSQGSFSRWSR